MSYRLKYSIGIIGFALSLMLMFSVPIVAQAATYDTSYPSNIPVSGGAFYACQSSLGQISVVVPIDYKAGTFGFSGSGSNVCNLTNGTVNGYLYTTAGQSYQIRYQRLGTLEYYRQSGTTWSWTAVTVNSITSTNIQFMDETDRDRQTDNYDYEKHDLFQVVLTSICALVSLMLLVAIIFRGRK